MSGCGVHRLRSSKDDWLYRILTCVFKQPRAQSDARSVRKLVPEPGHCASAGVGPHPGRRLMPVRARLTSSLPSHRPGCLMSWTQTQEPEADKPDISV
jgi:hypothetical protein